MPGLFAGLHPAATPSVPTGNTWLQTVEQGMAQPGQEVLCGHVWHQTVPWQPGWAVGAWLTPGEPGNILSASRRVGTWRPSSDLTEHLSKEGTTLFQQVRCTHQLEENSGQVSVALGKF